MLEKSITINQICWRGKKKKIRDLLEKSVGKVVVSPMLVKNSEGTLAYDMRHSLQLKRFNGPQFNLN